MRQRGAASQPPVTGHRKHFAVGASVLERLRELAQRQGQCTELSKQRRGRLRQQIERRPLTNINLEIWAGEAYGPLIQEVKDRTLQLQHRTLELLDKADTLKAEPEEEKQKEEETKPCKSMNAPVEPTVSRRFQESVKARIQLKPWNTTGDLAQEAVGSARTSPSVPSRKSSKQSSSEAPAAISSASASAGGAPPGIKRGSPKPGMLREQKYWMDLDKKHAGASKPTTGEAAPQAGSACRQLPQIVTPCPEIDHKAGDQSTAVSTGFRGRTLCRFRSKNSGRLVSAKSRQTIGGGLEGEAGPRRTMLFCNRSVAGQALGYDDKPGRLLVCEDKRDVFGLEVPVEASVLVYAEHETGSLALEVRTRLSGEAPERCSRELSRAEVTSITEWGKMVDQAPSSLYGWISTLVELGRRGNGGPLEVLIGGFEQGYKDRTLETVKSDLKTLFSATQQKVKLSLDVKEWTEATPVMKDRKKEEHRTQQIQDAASRLRISCENTEALYEWYCRLDDGHGGIDAAVLGSSVQQALRVADRAPLTKEQVHQLGLELQSCANTESSALFYHFAGWLVSKFPFVSAMPAAEVRKFAHVACSLHKE